MVEDQQYHEAHGSYAERDPNGLSMNEPGAKADDGKLLPQLVLGDYSLALEQVTRVGTYGAKKYTPKGWKSVVNGQERYMEAAMRHWLTLSGGEQVDESGQLHLAQICWNFLATLQLQMEAIKARETEQI